MTFTVRDAEESELDELATVWFEAWRDGHEQVVPPELTRRRTRERFRDRLAAALAEVRVVGPVGAPIGFSMLRGDELYQLFVSAAARGSGVAAALIADAEARLSTAGVETAWLTCAVGNERAARFYERGGWRRSGTVVEELDTPEGTIRMDVWRYEKQLRRARLSLEHIEEASRVIDPVFRDSPQFETESLGERVGCRLVVKVETLNTIRSFKGRGAEFFTARLQGQPHLVCATAGNFGRGMAFAARKRGLPLTVFTSTEASVLKVARMRAMGADVRAVGLDPDEVHAAAVRFSRETGALLVQDGRDPSIAEGAGTIGVELLRWPEPFDAILVPLGDGALLGGVARWVKTHCPSTRMVGVCAAGAPAMARSWRRRAVVTVSPPATIADGISISTPFAESLANLVADADDILLVEDAALIEGMRLAHEELGLVLEPSGAAGLAALLTYGEQFRGKLLATILTGGSLTVEQMRRWVNTDPALQSRGACAI